MDGPTFRDLNQAIAEERAARHDLVNRMQAIHSSMREEFMERQDHADARLRAVETYQERQSGGVRAMAVLSLMLGLVSGFAAIVALIKA